jgi:hypothetical protein
VPWPNSCRSGRRSRAFERDYFSSVLDDDPLQQVNRWDDVSVRGVRDDLVADLWDHQPPARSPRLALEAPV